MITIKQGEDYIKVLKLQYADSLEPVNLTGVTAYSSMRDRPGGELYANANCSVITLDGQITVHYSDLQTAAMPIGDAGFDVWIEENGRKHAIYTARVQIVPPYTVIGDDDD